MNSQGFLLVCLNTKNTYDQTKWVYCGNLFTSKWWPFILDMVTDNYIYIACVQKFIVDIDMTMHGHDTTGSSTEQKKDLPISNI